MGVPGPDPEPTRPSGLPERDTLSLVPGITRGYSRPARILRPHVQTTPLAANGPRQPRIAARETSRRRIDRARESRVTMAADAGQNVDRQSDDHAGAGQRPAPQYAERENVRRDREPEDRAS